MLIPNQKVYPKIKYRHKYLKMKQKIQKMQLMKLMMNKIVIYLPNKILKTKILHF